MDLDRAIQELRRAKEGIERVIDSLDELQRSAGATPALTQRVQCRGRKFMGPQERQEVSQRMKKYWASRRKEAVETSAGPRAEPLPDRGFGRPGQGMKENIVSRVMSEMGRKGGKIGGKRSLKTMTKAQRIARAKKAAVASVKVRKAKAAAARKAGGEVERITKR